MKMSYDLFACMDYYWWSGFGSLSYIIGLLWFVYLILQSYVGSFMKMVWLGMSNSSMIKSGLSVEVRNVSSILLIMVMFSKLWGLNGGSFSLTTQMLYMIHMSAMLWLSLQISSMNWKFMQYMGNMVINNTPVFLGIILSIVELLGKIVRPFSLCLRLSMKMTTGHMLLGLLAGGAMSSKIIGVMLVLMLGFYLLFECLICMIQGFVFSLLVGEYFSEHTV